MNDWFKKKRKIHYTFIFISIFKICSFFKVFSLQFCLLTNINHGSKTAVIKRIITVGNYSKDEADLFWCKWLDFL